jgi:hypothetical protein
MSEQCPDTFPEDWVDPPVEIVSYGVVKSYIDGVRVIIGSSGETETRYTLGGLHYEHGYTEDGELSGHSWYDPEGIAEDSEV